MPDSLPDRWNPAGCQLPVLLVLPHLLNDQFGKLFAAIILLIYKL